MLRFGERENSSAMEQKHLNTAQALHPHLRVKVNEIRIT